MIMPCDRMILRSSANCQNYLNKQDFPGRVFCASLTMVFCGAAVISVPLRPLLIKGTP